MRLGFAWSPSFAPLGLCCIPHFPAAWRRGLYSYAASRLGLIVPRGLNQNRSRGGMAEAMPFPVHGRWSAEILRWESLALSRSPLPQDDGWWRSEFVAPPRTFLSEFPSAAFLLPAP